MNNTNSDKNNTNSDKNYICAILLENCQYSIAAKKLLEQNKNNKLHIITSDEKNKYKNHLIQTFPQIYFIDNNTKYLIGGYDNLSYLLKLNKDINQLNKEKQNREKTKNYNVFLKTINYLHK